MIIHIYYGTAGAAGLYLHEIKLALQHRSNHKFVSNYFFPFNYAHNYFFKITEKAGSNIFKKFKYLRLVIRFIEMYISFAKCAFLIVKSKAKAVNYSVTNSGLSDYL